MFIVTKDFAYGDTLTEADVKQIPWPQAAMPKGAFIDKDVLFPPGGKPRIILRQMDSSSRSWPRRSPNPARMRASRRA